MIVILIINQTTRYQMNQLRYLLNQRNRLVVNPRQRDYHPFEKPGPKG